MKKLLTILLFALSFSILAQEKFSSNADLHLEGWISKDGKYFYTYDYQNEKMMKWDLYRGKPEWIDWDDFSNSEDYYDYWESDDEDLFVKRKIGWKNRVLIGITEKRKLKITTYSGQTGEVIRELCNPYVPKGGYSPHSYEYNSEYTYVAYLTKSETVEVVDAITGEVVHSIPSHTNGQVNEYALFGPWLAWQVKADKTNTQLYHLEKKKMYTGKHLEVLANGMNYSHYLPKSEQLLVPITNGITMLLDPETDKSEEIEIPIEIDYITTDDKIVDYQVIPSKYSFEPKYLGLLSCYDPTRDFLISRDILAEEQTLKGYEDMLAFKEERYKETSVTKAYDQISKSTEKSYNYSKISGEGKMYCFNYAPLGQNIVMTMKILGCDSQPSNQSANSGAFNMKCFPTKEEAIDAYEKMEKDNNYNIQFINWSEFE